MKKDYRKPKKLENKKWTKTGCRWFQETTTFGERQPTDSSVHRVGCIGEEKEYLNYG